MARNHIPCLPQYQRLQVPLRLLLLQPRTVFPLWVKGCASGAAGFSLAEPVPSGTWAALIGCFQHHHNTELQAMKAPSFPKWEYVLFRKKKQIRLIWTNQKSNFSFFHLGYVLLLEHFAILILALGLGPWLYFQMNSMIQILLSRLEWGIFILLILFSPSSCSSFVIKHKVLSKCCHFSKLQC